MSEEKYYRAYILFRLSKIGTEWQLVDKMMKMKSEYGKMWLVTYVTVIYGAWDVIAEVSFKKLENLDKIVTSIRMDEMAEPYIRRRAIRHLEKGRVVIFGSGTGNPFFSTDTAAALRAVEIGANVLIKATKVDGVYDSDPVENTDAKLFNKLSYIDTINMRLRVMDSTAVTLCMENELPILVLNFWDEEALKSALRGEEVGTLISD